MGFLAFLPFLVPVYLFLEMLGTVDIGLVEGLVMSASEAYQTVMHFFGIL